MKDNGPISGWTAEDYMGLNPVAPFNPDNHYFTDNGTIPDGQQAAFLQQDGALRQVVQGLIPGATYVVEFWENGRKAGFAGTNDAPRLQVRMGSSVILPAHGVPPLEGYRQRQTQPWIATDTQMELAFVKTGPPGLDRTVLIDAVRLLRCIPGKLATLVARGNLTLSWDPSAIGTTLETTTSLKSPVSWTPVPGVIDHHVTVPVQGTTRFYRVRQ